MMQKDSIKITEKDLSSECNDALELFYSGIRSPATRKGLERGLKLFLVDVCDEILDGDFSQRARQFISMVKDNQQKATSIVLTYTRLLKQRSRLEKSSPHYLNPSTIPNRIKPIKKLVDMNGYALPWKRIYSTYPEKNNTIQGRGYTKDEIRTILEFADGLDTEFVILAMISSGIRLGAWQDITWKDIIPVYEADGKYTLDGTGDGNVVCAAITVYRGTAEEYIAFISIEAWQKLLQYKKLWIRRAKKNPSDSDPLVLARTPDIQPITLKTISRRIHNILVRSGMRAPLIEGQRRHDVPMIHGFRRFWDKTVMQKKGEHTLSSLVIKERLLGHHGLVKTDKNYFWTGILDMVPEYIDAMPDLIINESFSLRQKLYQERIQKEKLQRENEDARLALRRISELESKIDKMSRYQKV